MSDYEVRVRFIIPADTAQQACKLVDKLLEQTFVSDVLAWERQYPKYIPVPGKPRGVTA